MQRRLQALGRLKPGAMNKTEAAYAQHLELLKRAGEIAWYRFEGITFRLAPKTSLSPDFAVMRTSGAIEFHDVKGSIKMMADDAWAKTKVAADQYPFVFFIVTPKLKRDGGGWQINEV